VSRPALLATVAGKNKETAFDFIVPDFYLQSIKSTLSIIIEFTKKISQQLKAILLTV
jgi:hypothetical protein